MHNNETCSEIRKKINPIEKQSLLSILMDEKLFDQSKFYILKLLNFFNTTDHSSGMF